jgi:hypothetical protein
MFWITFLIHLLLFVYLILLYRGHIFLSPARFILLANYVYYFILWAILIDQQKLRYNELVTYSLTTLFSFGLLIGVLLYRRWQYILLPFYRPLDGLTQIRPTRLIYIVFGIYVLILVTMKAREFDTFDPIRAFSLSYLIIEGVVPEKGVYVKRFIEQAMGWLLLFLAVDKALSEKGTTRLLVSVLVLGNFVYLQSFSGSKSFVALPFWYFWLMAAWYGLISKRLQVLTVSLGLLSIPFILVYLNLLRAGYRVELLSFDAFIENLVWRMDLVEVLSGYLEHFEMASAQEGLIWPPIAFVFYLLPWKIATAIGIEKPAVSFDVAYTMVGLNNPAHLGSSAGVGIAAMMETLRPVGIGNFPWLAFLLAGIFSAMLTEFWHDILKKAINKRGIALVGLLVPSLHITGFFEVSPTVISKIVIFFIVGLTTLIGLLILGAAKLQSKQFRIK